MGTKPVQNGGKRKYGEEGDPKSIGERSETEGAYVSYRLYNEI